MTNPIPFIFIAVFVFVISMDFVWLYYRARLSPVQEPKGPTLAQQRHDLQTRIMDATIRICDHKKGSQFYKMYSDRKIKATTELLKLEREYDEGTITGYNGR